MKAILLCLDMPEGSMFGVDLKCWTTGPKFQGVRNVPAGAHFVYYSAVDTMGNIAVSSGSHLYLEDGDIWVARWQADVEQLVPLTDREEVERYKLGFLQHDFDQGLGPYPEEIYENWRALSSHITESTLDRLSPIGKLISSSTQEGSETDVSSTANETVFYTSIDRLSWARNSTPEKVTSIALDKTPVLDAIVKSNLSGDYHELLAEMQYAFVAFVLGQSFEAFEQWKRIVSLLCSCDSAITSNRVFYSDFIDTLSAHIEQAPDDFFVSDLSKQNFLHRCLSDLFELGEDTVLSIKLAKFRRTAQDRFQCKFSGAPILNEFGRFDSDDEDAPVIVSSHNEF